MFAYVNVASAFYHGRGSVNWLFCL